jgi:YVTN family beta-propeller protein
LTGSTLLNTQYFGAKGQLICDKVTDNGLDPIVNNSQGANIDLVFPFTIPDNVYRKIGREGLYQSDVNNSNSWSTLSLASLSCVQNRTSEQCDVLFALPDLDTLNQPQYMAYVPDTNEIWVADTGSDEIVIIDNATQSVTATISLTAGDAPIGIVYVPQRGVYVSCNGSSLTRNINIFTHTVVASLGGGVNPNQIIYAPSIDRLFVIGALAGDLTEINPQTNTLVTTIATGVNNPLCVTYEPSIDTLYVAGESSFDFTIIPRSTNIPSAPISTINNPRSIVANGSNVWIAGEDDIEVVDFSGTSLTVINSIGLKGYGMTNNAGIMYVTDNANSLLVLYDAVTFVQIASYPTNLSCNRVAFGSNNLWVSHTSQYVRPYLLDCNDSLPPFTMVNRNINLNWDLEFEFFDNTEIYTITQELNRPSPSKVADFVNDFVDIIIEEYPDDGTPTPIPIDNLCPTTGQVIVTGNFINPQKVMSVGIELQPVRGGMVSSESSASPISIPSDSPYIYDLTPAYGTTSSVSFKIDTPSLNLTGDYEIVLHFITQ